MKQYNITGMSCAACSARVEKAVSGVEGVTSCSVSLLTNSMGVEGNASEQDIIKAVENAGYGASVKGSTSEKSSADDDSLKDKESPRLIKRLVSSVIFLLVLMYISMGHMMWGFPLPEFLSENHIAMGLAQLLLTGIIMVINQKFFVSGFKGLINRSPNMDTLVALGSASAFVYSTYALFMMTDAQLSGNHMLVMQYMHELYFESAGMILTLITVGKLLEARAKGKTTNALKELMKLAPETAVVIRNGKEQRVSIEQVQTGDIFVVRAGESIPVDGVITEGECAVNESALTGESVPVDKAVGDNVSAATINQSGFIKCRALRVGEDTTLSQIIKMVSDASATKAPIAKTADKVSGIFVPAVISIAVVTLVVWLLCGYGFGYALARAISVLVISCPCALGLATPVAIMVGSGVGARNGILFKTAESLESTGRAQIVVLDKTGTITLGEPRITDIITAENVTEEEFLSLAYSLEKKSEHPLAQAVVRLAEEKGSVLQEVTDFKTLAGNGAGASFDGEAIYGGSLKFISSVCAVDSNLKAKAYELSQEGKTPLVFTKGKRVLGVLFAADIIRDESPRAIRELQNMGIRVVMLTGDNERTANAIGKQAGVDKVIAGVLPSGKAEVINELKQYGKTIMVGDGINDAPALTTADTGIAIGAGTDVAIDAADVVLMKSRLSDVPSAIRLSRKTLRNIKENLFWAFIYNVIGIPLAAGVWIPIFGWTLNPMFGAAAMSLSSFCVVTNALRLNLFRLHSSKRDRKIQPIDIKEIKGGNKTMQKTLKIEGMMCQHCEARVKKTLEKFDQVDSAVVSHTEGTAVVTLNAPIDCAELKKAVEEQDYTVVSCE